MSIANLKITNSGKYIVEPADDGIGLLIVTPEGDIRWARDRETAERYIKGMEKGLANGCEMRVATIEWREETV